MFLMLTQEPTENTSLMCSGLTTCPLSLGIPCKSADVGYHSEEDKADVGYHSEEDKNATVKKTPAAQENS